MHSSHNFILSGFSNPHLPQRMIPYCLRSNAQLVEQRPGVFQVGGVEALGEPAVDLGERRARLVATALLRQQTGETRRRVQLQ